MTEVTRTDLIESRIDKERSSDITLTLMGGLQLSNLAEAFEIAKAMAISGPCVPAYLQNNPGSCLYHVMRAARWRMDPFALAEDSFVMDRGLEKRIAYGSATFHAVIERNAPIKSRLKANYSGEGADRRCIVEGEFRDGEVRGYETPPLSKCKKNSPLWMSDPDQQLFYFARRAWARKWCPDILLGAFSRDELEDADFHEAKPDPREPAQVQMAAEESLSTRLSAAGAKRAGFDVAHVVAEIENGRPAGGETEPPSVSPPVQDTEAVSSSLPPPAGEEASPVASSPAQETEAQPTAPPPAGEGASSPGSSSPALPTSPPISGTTTRTGTPSGGVDTRGSAAQLAPPTTAAEYEPWVQDYCARAGAQEQLRAWWNSERGLRNRLCIPMEMVERLKKLVSARVAELKAAEPKTS